MTQVHIKTNINGDNLEFLCDPEETLLDVLRDKLNTNTQFFRKSIKKIGFIIKEGEHPIVPIMIKDAIIAKSA